MAGIVTLRKRVDYIGMTLEQTLTAAGQATDPILLIGDVVMQVTGDPAAKPSYVFERSTSDPAVAANWALMTYHYMTLVNGVPLDGSGLPVTFVEPGGAWWRVRLLALTAGPVKVAVSGGRCA